MRAVTLSTDTRILTEEAPLQVAYAEHFDEFTVIVGSLRGDARERSLGQNARAVSFTPRSLFSPSLWRVIRRANVLSSQDPFFAGLFGLFVTLLFRVPLHVQVHTNLSEHVAHGAKGLLLRFIAPFVLRRAARIRVVSEAGERAVRALGISAPVAVLPIFVDRSRFIGLERKKHPRFKLALLSIGRLSKEKQFEESIRALALLRREGHDAGLTIVGVGKEDTALRACAEREGVSNHVVFAGHAPDICPYLETADVLLVPSAYEGYGLVIVEGLSAGVPVIAYDVGIAREAGAIIAPEGAFTETVLAWAKGGPRQAELHGYPYRDQADYVRRWVDDVRLAAPSPQPQP